MFQVLFTNYLKIADSIKTTFDMAARVTEANGKKYIYKPPPQKYNRKPMLVLKKKLFYI